MFFSHYMLTARRSESGVLAITASVDGVHWKTLRAEFTTPRGLPSWADPAAATDADDGGDGTSGRFAQSSAALLGDHERGRGDLMLLPLLEPDLTLRLRLLDSDAKEKEAIHQV